MKITMQKIVVALAALATAATAAMPVAFAEGSSNLLDIRIDKNGNRVVDNSKETNEKRKAHRPYLEWRDRLQLGVIESESVIYVYAEAGEKIYFGSNVEHASDASIAAITHFGNITAAGMIASDDDKKKKTKEELDALEQSIVDANAAIDTAKEKLVYTETVTKEDGSTEEVKVNLRGSTIAVTTPSDSDHNKAYDPAMYYMTTQDKDAYDKKVAEQGRLKYETGSKISDLTNYEDGKEKIYLFKVDDQKTGVIQKGTDQEKIGPQIAGMEGTEGGYKPFVFEAPLTGTYSFRFLSTDYGSNDKQENPWFTPTPKPADEPFNPDEVYIPTGSVTWTFNNNEAADGSDSKTDSKLPLSWKGTGKGSDTNNKLDGKYQNFLTLGRSYNASTVATADKYLSLTAPCKGTVTVYYATSNEGTKASDGSIYKANVAIFANNGDGTYTEYVDETASSATSNSAKVGWSYKKSEINSITSGTINRGQEVRMVRYTGSSTGVRIYKVVFTPSADAAEDAASPTPKPTDTPKPTATPDPDEVEYNKHNHWDIDTYFRNKNNNDMKYSSNKRNADGDEIDANGNPTTDTNKKVPNNTDVLIEEDWLDNTCTVAAWDVTVVGTDGKKKPGRAWSDILFLNAGAHWRSIYPNVYILTDDGFLYQFASNGLQPYAFMFYANNRGFLYDPSGDYTDMKEAGYSKLPITSPKYEQFVEARRALQPLEHSFFSKGTGVGLSTGDVGEPPEHHLYDGFGDPITNDRTGQPAVSKIIKNYTPTDEHRDKRHKIFFSNPDPDAKTADGKPVANPSDGKAIEVYVDSKKKDEEGNRVPGELAKDIGNTEAIQLINRITPVFEGKGHSKLNYVKKKTGSDTYVNYGTYGVGGVFRFKLHIIGDNDARPADDTVNGVYNVTDSEMAMLHGEQLRIKLDFTGYQLQKSKDGEYVPVRYTAADPEVVSGDAEVGQWKPRDPADKSAPTEIQEAEANNIVWITFTLVDDGDDDKIYTVQWDGTDNHGNDVPPGEYDDNITKYYESGTVHFPLLDVERLPKGVKIKMLNNMVTVNNPEEVEDWTKLDFSDSSKYTPYEPDRIYYNNEAKPPTEKTEDEKDWNYNQFRTSWYFTGIDVSSKYPSTIGLGNNWTSGKKTNFDIAGDGALTYGDYTQADCDATGLKSTSGDAAYGNFSAIDMWTKFNQELPQDICVGINPENVIPSQPIVSFVAQQNDKEDRSVDEDGVKTALDRSHVYITEKDEKVFYKNFSGNELYGNTISTGYVSSVRSTGTTYEYVAWDIEVKGDDETFIKVDDSVKSGWTDLEGTKVMDDKDVYGLDKGEKGKTKWNDEINKPFYEDIYNKGSIYRNKSDFHLNLKYYLNTKVTGTTVVFGLVLDNIYAPTSMGIATYLDEDGYGKLKADDYDEIIFEPDEAKPAAVGGIYAKTTYEENSDKITENGITSFENNEYNGYTFYHENGSAKSTDSMLAKYLEIIGIVDMSDYEDEGVDGIGDIQDPGDVETNDNDGNVTDSDNNDEFDALVVNE